MQKQLEETRKAQAGSDKKVRELTDLLNKKKEEEEKQKKTAEQKVEELRQQLAEKDMREMRIRKATEAGISQAADLFDIDVRSEDGVDSFIETLNGIIEAEAQKRTEAEVDKRFPKGKKPQGGKRASELTYQDLLSMTDEEVQQLPDAEYNRIMGNATQ